MKRIIGTLLSFFLAAAQCLFCFGETKDDILELYSRYRIVRSQAQLPYISSPSSEPVITEGMKQFYLNGEVEIMMFHAYEPESFIVEDDFEFVGLEEDVDQDGDATVKNYFLTVNEIIIEELHEKKERRAKNEKMCAAIWIQEIDGTFYILGDPTLSSYYVRASDLNLP